MSTPIKSDDLWSQWSRKLWKPHYLFTGQEDFLIEQAYENALKHWLGEAPDPLSLDRLDAETHSVDEIIEAAQTVPFFGGKRVLRIQNTAQLTAADQKRMAQVLETLSPETH